MEYINNNLLLMINIKMKVVDVADKPALEGVVGEGEGVVVVEEDG